MYNIPFRLKIAAFYFFLQGGLGMILCVALWFFPIKSITMKILFFIFVILYSILNVEVGKGLRRLKKMVIYCCNLNLHTRTACSHL